MNGKVHDSSTWLDFEIRLSGGGLQRNYRGGIVGGVMHVWLCDERNMELCGAKRIA